MNDIVSAELLSAPHGSQPLLHDQWEFVYCLSGGGEYALGSLQVSFQKGDMAAVPPRTPHTGTAEKGSKFIQVHMDQPTLWLKEPCLIHGGGADCTGLLLVQSGRLRAYILSEDGREITLYRLLPRDLCLFSASCMLHSVQFDIMIESEEDSSFWIIPPEVYKSLMEESAAVANYTNEVMATRFTEVMWLMEQILWKSLDRRLAAFLLEEADLQATEEIRITHEAIGRHLGSPREVMTRLLRYFQEEGLVKLSRGRIAIIGREKLEALAE